VGINKIIFSYVGYNGHTVVIVNDQVVARDFCLLNSVALINYAVKDMGLENAVCNCKYDASNLFLFTLDETYDIMLQKNAIVNTFLHVQKYQLNNLYTQTMLKQIITYCTFKYKVKFLIEWNLYEPEIYGGASRHV
jgi:hypothetical protein